MRDSYLRFFSEGYVSKDDFFEFGLKETIYSPYNKAAQAWDQLKRRICNNEEVFIRGFGRNASGTHLYQWFYNSLLGNEHVQKDSTNNAEPTKIIRGLTGYSKTKKSRFELIRNYQVSHVFGRTKNIYAFTAPWNIVYMPKMLDPFTGHESTREMTDEYTALFQRKSYNYFAGLIDDFNAIITKPSFAQKLSDSLAAMESDNSFTQADIDKLRKSVNYEFSPIET